MSSTGRYFRSLLHGRRPSASASGRAEPPWPRPRRLVDVPNKSLNLLRRGVTIDIHAEGGDERFAYVTTTVICDSDPDGDGGVVLKLDGTIEEGMLTLPASVIDTAEEGPDGWEVHHGGLVFRFGLAESEPAFGPDGYFTEHPEAWEAHVDAVQEREASRDAKFREQQGQ